MEIVDINGKTPKVGDRIAFAVGWTTSNAYLNIGKVEEFKETKATTKMILTIEESGMYRYEHNHMYNLDKGKQIVIAFPASHCKFIIL